MRRRVSLLWLVCVALVSGCIDEQSLGGLTALNAQCIPLGDDCAQGQSCIVGSTRAQDRCTATENRTLGAVCDADTQCEGSLRCARIDGDKAWLTGASMTCMQVCDTLTHACSRCVPIATSDDVVRIDWGVCE